MTTPTMRVLSWNLWWRFGGNWQARQHGILATLRELSPDVAGLQEVWGKSGTSQAELLAADLNAPPDSPEVGALTEVMVDTWVAGGGGPAGVTLSTANPFAPREARRQIDQRIDYVLARPGTAGRPLTVERAFVADAPVDGLHPSDHYAMVADLR